MEGIVSYRVDLVVIGLLTLCKPVPAARGAHGSVLAMSPAAEREAMAGGDGIARTALAAGTAGLAFAAVFLAAGASDLRLLWLGGPALLLALAGCVLALAGRVPRVVPDRSGVACLALLVALAGWNALSLSWSVAPDRSWADVDRLVAYLAFVLVGLLLPVRLRAVAAGLAVLLGLALAWALAGKVVPALFPDGARVARLRSPVGYWNGLALLADAALPLGLWAAARREHPLAARAGGCVLLYAATVTVLLTYSRTGVAVGVLAVLAWLALARAPLEGLATLVLAGAPGLAVAALGFALPGVVGDEQPYAVRVRDGAWFGLALGGAALAVALLAALATRRELGPEARRRTARLAGAALVAALAAGLAVAATRGGGPGSWVAEFTSQRSEVTQGGGRLVTLGSNGRWAWWQEAWRLWERKPLLGHGAGTYELARRRVRVNELETTEPHSLPLQLLADLGAVGLALSGGAAAAGVVAVRRALRRREGAERAAALPLALLLGVGALHALVDIPWDFLAVTAPGALVLGALLRAAGTPRPGRPRAPAALAAPAVALAGAALVSLVLPWLAARRLDDAYAALGRLEPRAALAAARESRSLNGFSTEPLRVEALAQALEGRDGAALTLYEQAAVQQPGNWSTWYDAGVFELRLRRPCKAYEYLNNAYGLDPFGPAGAPGGPLDQVRPGAPSGCRR